MLGGAHAGVDVTLGSRVANMLIDTGAGNVLLPFQVLN
jgi:hypothetical protein